MKMLNDVFKDCTVKGNFIFLPDYQLDRSIYLKIKKAFSNIFGKWDRKSKGFKFDYDPSEKLQSLISGNDVNLIKEFQYFFTPKLLAKKLVELANIQDFNTVLEPSAGQGHIIEEIYNNDVICNIYAVELMEENFNVLLKKQKEKLMHFYAIKGDFLKINDIEEEYFDRIIANPPFSKNQDIDHVRQMYRFLKKGGVLISIMSIHSTFANDKKSLSFRAWLHDLDHEIINLPSGSFKESGTNVGAIILVIEK